MSSKLVLIENVSNGLFWGMVYEDEGLPVKRVVSTFTKEKAMWNPDCWFYIDNSVDQSKCISGGTNSRCYYIKTHSGETVTYEGLKGCSRVYSSLTHGSVHQTSGAELYLYSDPFMHGNGGDLGPIFSFDQVKSDGGAAPVNTLDDINEQNIYNIRVRTRRDFDNGGWIWYVDGDFTDLIGVDSADGEMSNVFVKVRYEASRDSDEYKFRFHDVVNGIEPELEDHPDFPDNLFIQLPDGNYICGIDHNLNEDLHDESKFQNSQVSTWNIKDDRCLFKIMKYGDADIIVHVDSGYALTSKTMGLTYPVSSDTLNRMNSGTVHPDPKQVSGLTTLSACSVGNPTHIDFGYYDQEASTVEIKWSHFWKTLLNRSLTYYKFGPLKTQFFNSSYFRVENTNDKIHIFEYYTNTPISIIKKEDNKYYISGSAVPTLFSVEAVLAPQKELFVIKNNGDTVRIHNKNSKDKNAFMIAMITTILVAIIAFFMILVKRKM